MSITEHVQAEVDKEDNRQKLREAPASARRHLFVGLDHSDWYVSSQFLDEDFTPPPPQLPNEVDYVWVGVEDHGTGSRMLQVSDQFAEDPGLIRVGDTSMLLLHHRRRQNPHPRHVM